MMIDISVTDDFVRCFNFVICTELFVHVVLISVIKIRLHELIGK